MKPFTIEEYQLDYLSEERLQTCFQEKWFKLFIPKKYNGLELTMEEGCQTLFDVATINGGLGWTINLGAGANWFAAFFPDEVAKSVFPSINTVIAGSGMATGRWKKKDDHFILDGRWTKCSGSAHATHFSVAALDENKAQKIFLVPREKITFEKDCWPIMGMKTASSYTISLNQIAIPIKYEFQIDKIKNQLDYPVFHLKFSIFSRLCMSTTFLGIVNGLLQVATTQLQKRTALQKITKDLKPLVKEYLKVLLSWAAIVEEKSYQNKLTAFQVAKMTKRLGDNNKKLFSEIQYLFWLGGLPFIEEDNLLHWSYRDVLTAAQHFLMKAPIE